MDPYTGEIRIFAGSFAPRSWALCDGQLLPISNNTALFSLLGTTYGGNGTSTFALPDLRGRAPMHHGAGPGLSPRVVGEIGGSSTVTLIEAEMPEHTHTPHGQGTANQQSPINHIWGTPSGGFTPPKYYAPSPNTSMHPLAIGPTGGSQPHNNCQPYLGINFIICLYGIYPPRS
ncbi:phage tail protein [Marinicrinis sediminis]|uniref:Phage tail protein n=1 Tax=Marinicrinis sediminis TaxID=1652465 RepID=A0ABW5REZ1_9BACL